MSVFIPIAHCFYCSNFIVELEIGDGDIALEEVPLSQHKTDSALDCLFHLPPPHTHMKLNIVFSLSVRNGV